MSIAPTRINLRSAFKSSAQSAPIKRKRPSPVSIRFSDAEKAVLEKRAKDKGQSVGPYIRDYVLHSHGVEQKTRNRTPVKDHEALARVLSALGRSEIRSDLNRLYRLARDNPSIIDDSMLDHLRKICSDIAAMRSDLITALGLLSGGP